MTKKKARRAPGSVVANNPKARHLYEILDTFEAGMVLQGSEVKSLRQGRASLKEAFAIVRDGDVLLIGMHIPPYKQAGSAQHDPTRQRKLLLHDQEIRHLVGKTAEKGLTLVPISCYFKNGFAKVELGLGKGKRLYDRRQAIKEREYRREVDRAIRRRR